MSGAHRMLIGLAASLQLLTVQPANGASDADLVGRPVADVLVELKDASLDFIYSTELLPESVRVLAQPASTNRLMIAREILAPHDLTLSVVRPGLYAVVRARQAAAQGMLRGQVVDARRGRPIPFARLELLPIGAVQWSDASGRFVIGPVPEGTYSLRVEAAGFQVNETADLAITAAGADTELRLQPATTELAEVVVATSRYAFDRAGSFGSVMLEGESLASQPSLGDDAIRALARLPGIAQSGVSAQSSIRGGEAGEVLTLLDGFPLRQAFHLPGYHAVFGMVDPGLIDEVEVYTGGFPARYGNRMAGVFDLRTIDAGQEPRTALGLSFFNASARHGGRVESVDAEWLASARVGTLRPLLRTITDDAGNPSYSDAYARFTLRDVAGTRLSANALWSRDELDIELDRRNEQAQIESRAHYVWLRADRDWGSDFQGSLWLGSSRIDSVRAGTINDAELATGAVADSRASTIQEFRSRFTWHPVARHWFEGGAEWTREEAEYRYAANAVYPDAIAALFDRAPTLSRDVELEPRRERAALFATHRWQWSEALVSELGLRAQRTVTAGTTSEEWIYDPRVNLRWQLAASTSLRAHWGRFHQTDEVQELKVEDGLIAFPAAQRSDHFILGIDHRLPRGLALRIEGFRKLQSHPRARFENALDVLSLIPELAPDRVPVAPDSAELRGTELSIVAENQQSTRWVSLVWSDAIDRIDGRHVPRSWDQTWAVTAGIDWYRGPWRLGAIATAHRGWPITRVDESGLGERNAARLPYYATLDLRAEYRRPLTLGSLALAFELSNTTNRRNACCVELVTVDDGNGNTAFDTKELRWLPIVPSISVLWEF
jgi:outer membrane receptor protein involved in Fe transport